MPLGNRGITDQQLSAYLDGELSNRTTRRIAKALGESVELQQRLSALEQVGDLLRTHAAWQADRADFSSVWPAVRASMASTRGTAPARARFWERVYAHWRGASVAVAGAAVVLLMLWWIAPPTAQAQRNDCVIESLEVGSGTTGSIFKIEDAEEGSETTVIWLTQDEQESES